MRDLSLAHLVVLACVGLFIGSIALVIGLFVLPIVVAAGGGYLVFRHIQIQRLRVQLPDLKSLSVTSSASQPPPHLSPRYDPDQFARKLHGKLLTYIEKDTGRVSCKALSDMFTSVVTQLYADESFHDPPPPPEAQDLISRAAYHDKLQAWKRRTEDATASELFLENFTFAYMELRQFFPDSAFQEATESQLTVPITIKMEPDQVDSLVAWFFQKDTLEYKLYEKLREQIVANTVSVEDKKGKVTFDSIFAHTPFAAFSDVRLPFSVPLSKQLEHSMISAGSRYGKSQLIGSIISTHLKSEDPPGMIILDSTGDFLKKITRLAVFEPGGRLASRLLVIDPAQVPQLNMFDISNIRAKGYGESDMEQIEGDVINLFEYVFRAIGSDLTPQQITAIGFCIRLLLSMPGSSIETLVMLLELPERKFSLAPAHVQQAIEKLDPNAQRYFKNQFFTDGMHATRTGVANRIYNVIKAPSFLRMFTGQNRIDFFEAMQQGKIIVVNTNKSLLQPKPSALFGRYVIARVMSAAFERSTIADMSKRRPCLLIIDEAQEYFDDSIETLLNQIGKFRLGICIAFQNFAQLNDKLRASVIGSTSVKYAGGLIGTEAHMIAREMRTNDDFILAQVKDSADPPQWAKFAVRVSSLYEHAVSITVPFYTLENMPKMTDAQHAEFLRANKEAVSPAKPTPPPSAPSAVQEPAEKQPAPTKPTPKPQSPAHPADEYE